jgi:hypothetical protein
MLALAGGALIASAGLAAPPPDPPPSSVIAPTSTPLAVSSSSSNVALPASAPYSTVYVFNEGTVEAFIALGGNSVVATTTGIAVPAGTGLSLWAGSNTYLAAITASSTTTLRIMQANGPVALKSGGGVNASNAVTSFNGRTGAVAPTGSDYSSFYCLLSASACLWGPGTQTFSNTGAAGKQLIIQSTTGTANEKQLAFQNNGTGTFGIVPVSDGGTASTTDGLFLTYGAANQLNALDYKDSFYGEEFKVFGNDVLFTSAPGGDPLLSVQDPGIGGGAFAGLLAAVGSETQTAMFCTGVGSTQGAQVVGGPTGESCVVGAASNFVSSAPISIGASDGTNGSAWEMARFDLKNGTLLLRNGKTPTTVFSSIKTGSTIANVLGDSANAGDTTNLTAGSLANITANGNPIVTTTDTQTLSNKTLTAPVLGAATATTINKVTLTAPATGSTLTIADGKTLTASNTLTLTATDGSTLAIGGGGTLGSAAYQSTGTSGATLGLLNGTLTFSGADTFSSSIAAAIFKNSGNISVTSQGTAGYFAANAAATATDTSTATGTNATKQYMYGFLQPTLAASNSGVTYSAVVCTLCIDNAPAAGTNVTLSAPRALYVAAGTSQFNGSVNINSSINLVTLWESATAPSIASGFGTTPSVGANNGTAAFTVNVGTGGTATSGVITMPAASHGWSCPAPNDLTTTSATVFMTKVTATTTTSITIGNFTTAGAAGAWASGDVIQLSCTGY